jgi:hypothetical protein
MTSTAGRNTVQHEANRPGSRRKDPASSIDTSIDPPRSSKSENKSHRRQTAAGRFLNREEETHLMSRAKWIALAALLLIATGPLLLAGEGKDCEGHADAAKAAAMHAATKCNYSTQDCLDHMAAKLKSSGWVGIELEKDDTTGVMTIQRVIPGSPAESAGLQPGDVLFALNGIEINDQNEDALKTAKKEWKPGQTVNYTLKRNGQERKATLTLAPMPADVLAKFIGQHMLEHATTEVASK